MERVTLYQDGEDEVSVRLEVGGGTVCVQVGAERALAGFGPWAPLFNALVAFLLAACLVSLGVALWLQTDAAAATAVGVGGFSAIVLLPFSCERAGGKLPRFRNLDSATDWAFAKLAKLQAQRDEHNEQLRALKERADALREVARLN